MRQRDRKTTRTALLAMLILASVLGGCASVTITESGPGDFRYRPDYDETKHFFLWGFIGDNRVDVQQVCGDMPAIQMQTKFTAMNVLYTALTAGLYLPRTARVWCKREGEL